MADLSVDDFTAGCITHGAIPLGNPPPLSRWDAVLEPVAPGVDEVHLTVASGLGYHVIAHEVFHLFEDAVARRHRPTSGCMRARRVGFSAGE